VPALLFEGPLTTSAAIMAFLVVIAAAIELRRAPSAGSFAAGNERRDRDGNCSECKEPQYAATFGYALVHHAPMKWQAVTCM
jgi:hypothetical protein